MRLFPAVGANPRRRPASRLAALARLAGYLTAIGAAGAAVYAAGQHAVAWMGGRQAAAVAEAQREELIADHTQSIQALGAGQKDIAQKLGEVREDVRYIRGRLDQIGPAHATTDPPKGTAVATP